MFINELPVLNHKTYINICRYEQNWPAGKSRCSLLNAGDTVNLIKDLNVKGAGFTAKRGTAVRSISLVPDNPEPQARSGHSGASLSLKLDPSDTYIG